MAGWTGGIRSKHLRVAKIHESQPYLRLDLQVDNQPLPQKPYGSMVVEFPFPRVYGVIFSRPRTMFKGFCCRATKTIRVAKSVLLKP